ncbi:MAG: cupredoxin domain-containing protein, partial [Actinomycetota bacterium]
MRRRWRGVVAIGGAAVIAVGFLFVAVPASAGGFCIEPATEAKGATVEMKGSCFTPTVLRAPAGEPVAFVNRDAVNHTVTGIGEWALAFRHDEIKPGKTFSVQLDTEGIYVYSCLIHPGMAGA